QTIQEANEQAQQLMEELKRKGHTPNMKLFDNPAQASMIWLVRESGLGASTFIPGEKLKWEGWEDSAVPPEKMGAYLRDLRKLYDQYDYQGDFYGHFGQGCVHTRIDFDMESAAGIKKFRSFIYDAAKLVIKYGGSLSGEHGDGQARAELLPMMYGDELVQAFRKFKSIWDPDWKMNPGKVVRPNALDSDLKLALPLEHPRTAFAYPHDGGDMRHAVTRCVGVGRCRKPGGQDVMCPSYIATREEEHTTRGRARLLFELMAGELLEDRWRSREVEEALDLCLACKGCTRDCPAGVDMPTLKAEFLH